MVAKKAKRKVVLVLPDIRSALNVGSIFRTAEAAGVTKIYLTGYTPSPKDNFGRINKQISKTALGAEKNILWEKIKPTQKLLRGLNQENFQIVAVEQAVKSIDYKKFKLKNNIAFIFGNETEGLSKKILNKCHQIIEIPMCGQKESLNVSVSVGIVLFRILNI